MNRMRTFSTLVFGACLAVAVVSVGCAAADRTKDESEIKDAEWHYKMGVGYFENHKIHPAKRSLMKALEMDPEMAKAHFLLGFIYSGRRKYHKAIEHYKKAIELKENYYQAKNNLGSVYLAMERWRSAVDLFEGLIEESMYPTPELAHNNLGWAHYNLRNYDKAQKHLKTAVFLKPGMCLAYNNLGLTHREIGNLAEAKDKFRKAIRKCPDRYAEPHFNLAKILQREGDPSAQQHFRECARLKPESNLGNRCRQYVGVR